MCHACLDVFYSGVCRVFAGFGVVVEEVWGEDVFGARHDGGLDVERVLGCVLLLEVLSIYVVQQYGVCL